MAHPASFFRWSLLASVWGLAAVAAFVPAIQARAAEKSPKRTMAQEPLIEPPNAKSVAALRANPMLKSALETAQQVDRLLANELSPPGSDPSASVGRAASNEVLLRRIYLDLIGRNPTPEEVTAFAFDPSDDKRANVVDQLLERDEFGANWARYWRDVVMFRRSDDRGQIAGPAMIEYLTDQFNKNTSWDVIARSFITATGDVRENGATGLIMAQEGDTANIASEVSRIFIGVQIQCAQCHDHKTDRWKREQFHQLAAFFPRVTIRPLRNADKRSFQVVGVNQQRRLRGSNQKGGELEHYMPDLENPTARGEKMNPVFFLTEQTLESGSTDAQRREAVAKWITSPQNQWFAKAFVNRIWAELVGEGFYHPIDDLGPDRDCTAPQTMELLAKNFVASKFDIKHLFRTIAATSAYQRESCTRRNATETAFANNCPQRLRGDQLYNSLLTALGFRDFVPGGGRYALLRGPRGQFDQVFGYDPSDPRDEVVGTIPQALMLMNGTLINSMIRANRRTELGSLLASTDDNEAAIVELYLRCLSREPNSAELQTCLTHVNQTGNRSQAFEDVLWALVNSTEFLVRK
ncbi:MAG: DUF1549 domain-containing protein [Pirellulales bacterium]|nr:DUF1549 domain-containing protein [Pirellulales bacterium]